MTENSPRKVLITGGTGLIGTRLAEMLIDSGYEVALLSREPTKSNHFRSFRWDPQAGTIDEAAIPYADYIVNLAGASVSDGKWTDERKRDIMTSRLGGLALLHRELAKQTHHVKAFISASAIGVYGDTADTILTEETPPGLPTHDFLADVAHQWELATEPIAALGIRTVIPRIGIVLSTEGGALPQMARPMKLGAGAALGSGKQFMSWIHLDDLCRLIMAMIDDDSWRGTYNAVAPAPVTNQQFTETLAQVLHRRLVLPKVPAFGLKLALGEMSEIVLASQRVSADKVLAQGFTYEYPELRGALDALYGETV
ncbi:TIGR01777 family oxidoreductase [Hymenobacter sp. BT770]|uniref:TIGR01777 family oxidoreductase n=1 Tax=Hymenobacter sp. BT770 TaxID=2886942 RepID=UPI001D12A40C|nr:TIGR01777 family oxidoreductase [Hymenobacter sp. BT770]MCC3152875.1 TIGR01777 family oxidoreductase [Hymenobacter sp. BT770]MDO3414950.1 TIGR01777 family oxidoreductase [Hymenobacter sp. BT770]